jgi:hypothetical protein
MSDIIDIANDAADLFLADSLTHRTKPAEIPKGIGVCLECRQDLDTDRRWCDADCRNEWERVHVSR